MYHQKYYTKLSKKPPVQLLPYDLREINFQRSSSKQNEYKSDLAALKYQFRGVRLPTKLYRIKSLQCVNTATVKWFVTFGGFDKYMYLLEPASRSKLRVTGLFEPSAIISKRHIQYFIKQFRESRGRT